MKKGIHAVSALACAALLALGAAACGDDSDDNEATAGGGSQQETFNVAVITSGSHTDSSWVQSWWEGSQAAQRELGDRVEVTWTDGLNSLDALDRGAGAALTEGNDFLFISTSEAPQLVDEYAEKFPDQWICDIETPRETYPENACTVFPRFHEGGFLAGALAGLVTKSNKIAAVAAFDIPIQNLQVEAFALGARYVNPDVSVERVTTESLIDAGKARAGAQAQYAAGADVILSAVDDAIRGIYLAAKDHDGLVIPQYTDQYEDAPDVVLSSVLYHHAEIGKQLIQTAVDGQLEPKSYDFGLKELSVGELAPFRGATGKRVSQEARDRLDEIRQGIEDGTIELPAVEVLAKRGSGDEVDPQSLGG